MKGHDQLVLTDPERAAEPTRAPDLVGRPIAVANETARDHGLTVTSSAVQVDDATQWGLVVAQDPAVGEPIDGATALSVLVGTAAARTTDTLAEPSERGRKVTADDDPTGSLEEWLSTAKADSSAAPYVVDLGAGRA